MSLCRHLISSAFLVLLLLIFQYAAFAMTSSEARKELNLPAAGKLDDKEIKKAYRKRSLETHPDKGGDSKEFIRVAEAYNVLTGKGGSGTGGFDTSGMSDEEAFKMAEEMLFDMAEELLHGTFSDDLIDQLFDEFAPNSTWTSRATKNLIKYGAKKLIKGFGDLLMSENANIKVNGEPVDTKEIKEWYEKMKRKKERVPEKTGDEF